MYLYIYFFIELKKDTCFCVIISLSSIFLSASDYGFEEEARDYVNSVHIDDDPVDKYSLPEQQQQLQEDFETEVVVDETPVQEASPPVHNVAHTIRETPTAPVEESFEEPAKKTYASIVCTSLNYFLCFFDNLFVLVYIMSIKFLHIYICLNIIML